MNRRALLLAAALLTLGACSKSADKSDTSTLTVAATPVPHAEILDHIKPVLARQGVTLDVRVFNDYVQPNTQVEQHRIDVNYFETAPYLKEFNAKNGTHLMAYAGIHIEPLGAYSKRWKSIAQIPVGALVVIPNESSNSGRAPLLLAKSGLITLKDPHNALATIGDIKGNPKQLKFRELESATLPRVLGQVDLALINTNYALDAKLNPVRDALIIEDANSPYVNLIVGLPGGEKDPRVVKLIAALRSDDVKDFIRKKYDGAVVPAF